MLVKETGWEIVVLLATIQIPLLLGDELTVSNLATTPVVVVHHGGSKECAP